MPKETFLNLSEGKKEIIINAAKREFARVPFQETSIKNIVEDAGIARGSFYQYFESKEDLLEYIISNHALMVNKGTEETFHKTNGDIFEVFISIYDHVLEQCMSKEDIKLYKTLRKYNTALILFLLILTTFQQWYLVWLFATIMWQKTDMIRNIVGLSLIAEIANSIYMLKSEWYVYDICFVGFIICLFIAWQLNTNKYIFKDRRKQIG